MQTFLMNGKERDRLVLIRRVEQGFNAQTGGGGIVDQLSTGQATWAGLPSARRRGAGPRVAGSTQQQPGDARRELGVALYRELAERHDLTVDHEPLRGWLIGSVAGRSAPEAGASATRAPIVLGGTGATRRQRTPLVRSGSPALRAAAAADGDDDATSWTEARFFEAETTEAAMTVFRGWAMKFGLPVALYPDRHSIHRRNDKQSDEIEHRTGKRPPTRFGEAMAELGVNLIWAGSPQAKGRVERANGTHQDRLVKPLALEGITDIAAAAKAGASTSGRNGGTGEHQRRSRAGQPGAASAVEEAPKPAAATGSTRRGPERSAQAGGKPSLVIGPHEQNKETVLLS